MVDTSVGDPDQGADSSNAVPEGTQHTQEWKLAIEREEKKGTKGEAKICQNNEKIHGKPDYI